VPRAPRWYDHVEAATGLVPCEGQQHRLTWRRGKLKLEDHDLSGERALLVLGGQPCPCLQALRLWEDQFGLPPEQFEQLHSWLGAAAAALAPRELDRPRDLSMILSWERSWRKHAYMSKHGKIIERAVRERALPALKAHLQAEKQRIGTRVIRSADVKVVPAGRPLNLTGTMDRVSGSAEALLSSTWVLDVWARGIAVVDGAFVLEVVGDEQVTAVRWHPGPGGVATPQPAPARLRPGDGGWHLAEV
jgi:hypothetical protein